MRIDIVMNDLTKLMACADNVTVLPQRYYDANHNDTPQQIIPMMVDKQNKSEIEYDEVEMMIEEFKHNSCKCLVIPYSNSVVIPTPGFSKEFVIALVNHEAFEKVLLKPDDYFLDKIIIQVNKEGDEKTIEKELAIKSTWSKARQLSFILDALKLKRPETCELHYINTNDYSEYLEKFCVNCKEELLTRAENIFITKHSEANRDIYEIIKKFSEINKLYLNLYNKNQVKNSKVFSKVMKSEYPLIDWTTTKREPFLMDKLQFINPLFVYIKHLIPDYKWYKYGWQTKQPINRRGKKKEKAAIPDDVKPEVKSDYKTLLYCIYMTRLWQKSSLPFPINLLQEFWAESVWKRIIAETETDSELVVDLLAEHHGVKNSSIENIIFRKAKQDTVLNEEQHTNNLITP